MSQFGKLIVREPMKMLSDGGWMGG